MATRCRNFQPALDMFLPTYVAEVGRAERERVRLIIVGATVKRLNRVQFEQMLHQLPQRLDRINLDAVHQCRLWRVHRGDVNAFKASFHRGVGDWHDPLDMTDHAI